MTALSPTSMSSSRWRWWRRSSFPSPDRTARLGPGFLPPHGEAIGGGRCLPRVYPEEDRWGRLIGPPATSRRVFAFGGPGNRRSPLDPLKFHFCGKSSKSKSLLWLSGHGSVAEKRLFKGCVT